jgi:alpha-beta hydrolase superfamily lysophospholipase
MHRIGNFTGAGKVQLFRQSWRPHGPEPSGTLVLVHGLGDHSGLYSHLVEHLVAHGWAVHAYDQRGNGRSPGRRGHVARWSDYREDLQRFVTWVADAEPERPLFLLGNSLGGLVVLEYALEEPAGVSGVVAVAPALTLAGVPAPLLLAGRILSALWPAFTLETGLDLSGIAQDPSIAQLIVSDPLFHRKASARLSTETAAAMARVLGSADRFRIPLLLLHGGADRMVPPAGTRELARRLPSGIGEYHEYPGSYHALLADVDRAAPLDAVERWMRARSSLAAPRSAQRGGRQ